MASTGSRRLPRNAPHQVEVGDTAEIARFEAKIVRGPGPNDCWIWTGAIGDDGYGRFWIRRNGIEAMVRPPRYAVALYIGPVPAGPYALHARCDNPICVRAAHIDGHRPHVVLGTQQENLAIMGTRGRSYGGKPVWQHNGLTRAQRAARSRALRAAVSDGWNPDAVRRALLLGSQPTLFDEFDIPLAPNPTTTTNQPGFQDRGGAGARGRAPTALATWNNPAK